MIGKRVKTVIETNYNRRTKTQEEITVHFAIVKIE